MSTRCQLGIYEKKPEQVNLKKWDVLLYKHCDGYEEGVLPDLIPFLKYFKEHRGISDTEYCGAWLIKYLIDQSNDSPPLEKYDCIGYGISNCFHGDIEYFYAIYPNAVDIYDCGYSRDTLEWKKIKTVEIQ